MAETRFIAIRNQADKNVMELYFLDVIADTYDWFTGFTCKVQEIIDKVNYYKPSLIRCIIDSEGGDAPTGMAIYNFLKRTDAKVEVEIIGLAASIASVIAMAANKGKLKIAKNAFMMIHNAEGGAWGTSEDLRKHANLVDMYSGQIVDIYAQRTGMTVDAINALMSNGDYWMTGTDAVAMGFADATFNDTANVQVAARLDPAKYKNLPSAILAQITPKPKPDSDNGIQNFFTNQIEEMKNFFKGIVDAIKGVKPAADATPQTIVDGIANAISTPFENLGNEIETTISNQVNTATSADAFVTKIVDQVVLKVPKATDTPAVVDFAADGPAKTALDAAVTAAVKVAVDAAVKPYQTIIAGFETTKADLEAEILNLKGGSTRDKTGQQVDNKKILKGSFA